MTGWNFFWAATVLISAAFFVNNGVAVGLASLGGFMLVGALVKSVDWS